MALPLPAGLTPSETAFLAEMELVTIIPRQRLDSLPLLTGPTPPLRPPHPTTLPLWLALLLARQRRADILPPPWLCVAALQDVLDRETTSGDALTPSAALPPPSAHAATTTTPPFIPSSTTTPTTTTTDDDDDAVALPYNYLPLSTLLLTHCGPSIPDAEAVRRLLRDISEVRGAKMRAVVGRATGAAGVDLSGVGAMEVGERRGFLGGVVDGLRRVGASREERGREEAGGVAGGNDSGDEDML